MANTHKLILIVSSNETFVREISAHLTRHSPSPVTVKNCRMSEAETLLKASSFSAVLFDLISPSDSLLPLIQKMRLGADPPRIIGAGQPPHVSLLMQLIKAGVRDFLNIPFEE